MTMTESPLTADLGDRIAHESAWVGELQGALHEVIVGQEDLLHGLLIALLTGGHVLVEGLPGLAKTLAVSSLAGAVHGSFARVQFTPDLLPSDLIGTEIYNQKDGTFSARLGPIFANFLLADEVNRAPAKVQSALLEAMQERQVSIGGETFPLPHPFLALATMNPIEQEGTYRLPEAQVDRFFLKLLVDYPSETDELSILDKMATTKEVPEVPRIIELATIQRARELVDSIHIDPRLQRYMVRLVRATRSPSEHGLRELEGQIQLGASPRASIVLSLASRANAFLEHRGYVTPGDVKRVAPDALRHRRHPELRGRGGGAQLRRPDRPHPRDRPRPVGRSRRQPWPRKPNEVPWHPS